jgi:hypothetical protein
MRFISLQGIMCRSVSRIIGFPRYATTAVSGQGDASSFRPFPGSFESGSFPRASCPLRSLFAFLPAPPFRAAACLGVLSLFAVSPEESTIRGVSQFPLRSVLRFSQPRDGLLRFRSCGLVSSRYHVQGFRSGAWSRPAAVPARRRPVPPCPFRAHAHRLPGCHTRT